MDLFEILFIMVFILAPLLEGVLRRGKGQKGQGKTKAPPRGGRPPQRPRRPREEARLRALETASQPQPLPRMQGQGRSAEAPWWEAPQPAGSEERALDISVPDDVWEILTGERPAPEEDAASMEGAGSAWEEGLRRRPEEHPPPEVVSLETAPLPPELRHTGFHAKLDSTAPVLRRRSRGRVAVGLGLNGAKAARRAVVLREVLGPPRGLEEWG